MRVPTSASVRPAKRSVRTWSMAWSAAHGADVQTYQADWSWDQMRSWLAEQNPATWQDWSQNWQPEASWER